MRKHKLTVAVGPHGRLVLVNDVRVAGPYSSTHYALYTFRIEEIDLDAALGRELVVGGYAVKIFVDNKYRWLNQTGGYGDRVERRLWETKWEAQEAAAGWVSARPKIVHVKYYKRRKP